ncbi:MAG: beta-glucanase (GH16 family) [Maribacter sp.]|jgi:beta-glucanase (GH16 family)
MLSLHKNDNMKCTQLKYIQRNQYLEMKKNYSNWIKSILPLAIIFMFLGCGNDNKVEEYDWQLVWSDEFEGEEGQSLDETKWNYDIGTDWGNNQQEYDTDRLENVSLDGAGNLAITAIRENFEGSSFTSARITTKGLFDQAYGRFEARIKMPLGSGIWPAFWMLGTDIDVVSWPQCGEIDIVEYRGQEPTIIHGSVHGPGYSGGAAISKTYTLQNSRFDVDFHLFAVEWTADYIDFYVDDNLYQRIEPDDVTGEWVYDHSFYIILNLAIGGNFVGFDTANTSFPQTMLVDWVRVYKDGI